MRRASIVIISVFIAIAVAVPSFAVEFDATGSLRFQGVYNQNAASSDDNKPDSYRDMRLRVKTELKVTDKITLVTRFDALDKVLSSNDSAFEEESDGENIDFDRAYMKIISPVGLFVIGRQEGITWGTSFADDEDDTDRIKYVLPIPVGDNKLYIGIVAEKVGEEDKGTALSNKDNDKYYVSATYVAENFRAGFLTGFYHFNTFQDPGQATLYKALNAVGGPEAAAAALADATKYGTLAAAAGADLDANLAGQYGILYNTALASPALAAAGALQSLTRGTTAAGKVWLISPYFTGKFGGLGISTELDYITGKTEYDVSGADDRDVAAYSFMFETTYDAGPAGFQIGFATSSGDTDFSDDDIESMGYVSPGLDWGKMFILSADDHGMNTTLGVNNMGNHAGDGFGDSSTTLLAGYQMFYIGADFDVNETMNIGTIMCMSKADDAPDTFDDDQGFEVDVTFGWKMMDNLQYTGTIAYLAAGDYWKGAGEAGDGDDTIALFHRLELTF